jgi:hypothetical protein
VSSTTGLIFSYAIGAIFALGGIAFMIFLDERRFLFGVPYLLLGLALLYGVARSQRRRHDRETPADGEDPSAR